MADAINRQVKVDVVMDVSNALRSVKGIQQALDKLSIKRIKENEVDDPFEGFTGGAKRGRKELESFQKQLTQAKKQLENDLVKNNMSFTFINSKDFKDQTKKIEELTSKVRAFKELMNSLDQQKVLKNTTVANGTVADSNAVSKYNTAELKRAAVEQKNIQDQRKKDLKDAQNQVKELTAEVEKLRKAQEKLQTSQKGSNGLLGNVNTAGFKNYSTELAKTERYAAQLNYELQRTSRIDPKYNKLKEELEKVRKEYAALNRESVNFRKDIGISGSRGFYDINHTLDYFRAKVRSRLVYSFATEAEGLMMNLMPNFIDALSQYQQNRVNFAQVMPNELANNQEAMNKAMREFIQVAADYGASVEDVIEAGRLWGRIYKDVNVIQELVRASTKLSITDDMSLVEVNKGLEATMQQYAVHLKDANEAQQVSGKIIDTWAKLADNAGVTAANLAAASERAGGAAYQAGVGFDSLQAMIATMSQVTGKAGGEIGRSIRSMLVSMNTDRARKEIEKLGVAIYELGDNGEMKLRSMEKVIPEVMQALAKSNKDISKSVLTFSGGKYQYNNVMALLRSYELYMKNLETARTSAGWADEQVALQYETISRQIKALNADFQQLIATLDEAGSSNGIADIIQGLRTIVQFLAQIDPENVKDIINTLKGLFAIKLAGWATKGLTNVLENFALLKEGLAGLRVGFTLTATGAATFTTVIGTMFKALSGVGSLFLLAQGLMAVYDVFQENDESGKQFAESIDKTQKSLDGIYQTIQSYKENSSVVSDLAQNIQEYRKQLENANLTDEERANLNMKLVGSENQLKVAIGEAGMRRLEAAGWTEEAIQKEVEQYYKLRVSFDQALQAQIDGELENTKNVINQTQIRINERMREIEVMQKLADTRLFYQKAVMKQAEEDFANGIIDNEEYNKAQQDLIRAQKESVIVTQRSNEAIAFINQQRNAQKSALAAAERATRLSKGELAPRNSSGNKDIPGGEGGVVDGEQGTDTKGKKSSGGSSGNTDYSEKAKRNQYQRVYNELLYDGKIAATEFNNAVRKLDYAEQFEGKTVENASKRVDLYKERQQSLSEYQKQLEEYQQTLIANLDAEMAANQDVAEAVGYKQDATVNEKLRNIEVNRELYQQIKSYSEIVNQISKVNQQIETTKGNITEVTNKLRTLTELPMSADAIFERDNADADFNIKMIEAMRNPKDPYAEDRDFAERLRIEKERLDDISDLVEDKRDEWEAALASGNQALIAEKAEALQKAELQYAEYYQNIKKMELSSTQDIRQGFADITTSLIVEGESWKDIWSNLWQDLAREAIQVLFGVQNVQKSFLGSLVGGGKGKGKGVTEHTGGNINSYPKHHTGANVMTYPKMHSGGMVEQGRKGVVPQLRNDEVVRTLQVGEEVNSLADRRSNEILGAVAMKALDSEQNRPNYVNIMAMDSKSFAEYLNENSDILMAIIGKQQAMGRGTRR